MKTAILAGGFGTRLGELTGLIPKPMVPIGGKPILWHIMNHYASYGYNDFVVALGYKGDLIKQYFLNYFSTNSDFTVHLKDGSVHTHGTSHVDWKITLVDTGADSMTGGRLARLKSYLGNETFMLTYGDGLSSINIEKLVEFHRAHGKKVTISAVHPDARFGELRIGASDRVEKFAEKPQMDQGWINGGFFVMEPEFIDYIHADDVMLEKFPLEQATKEGELYSYRHDGFWQCMDTKRDHDQLEEMWLSGSPPWV